MVILVDKYKKDKIILKAMEKNSIKSLFSIIGISIFLFLAQKVEAGDHKNRLSINNLENPAGWAAPYNPGIIIAEMLKQTISNQGSFHLSPTPQPSRESDKPSEGSQLKHPIQYILGGNVLHFTPGKPPTRAQIILNIGEAMKQRAEVAIELELTSHHIGTSIAKKKFIIDSIAGTVPFDLDASAVSFDSQNFQNSSIGKALMDLNHQVNAFMMTTLHPLPLEAEVISVDSEKKEVIINVGHLDGIDFGDIFSVYSVILQYKDPYTQMNLGSGFTRRGVIRVNNVQEGFSTAAIIAGEGFTLGELARSRKTNPVVLDRNANKEEAQTPWWKTSSKSSAQK